MIVGHSHGFLIPEDFRGRVEAITIALARARESDRSAVQVHIDAEPVCHADNHVAQRDRRQVVPALQGGLALRLRNVKRRLDRARRRGLASGGQG